jgi:hypothetical protein
VRAHVWEVVAANPDGKITPAYQTGARTKSNPRPHAPAISAWKHACSAAEGRAQDSRRTGNSSLASEHLAIAERYEATPAL